MLFTLPAETAHDAGKWALRRAGLWRLLAARFEVNAPALTQTSGGLTWSNPIGLAPGFDKDCEMLDALASLGFGFLEVGTIMLESRRGNLRPRLLRYPDRRALVNCMGLPSRGMDYCLAQLKRWAQRRTATPVIVSFLDTTLDGYVHLFEMLQPWADALELALWCPNTPEEADFVDPTQFERLLAAFNTRKTKPLFVKLPSLDVEVPLEHLQAMVDVGLRSGVDGFVVSGTYPVAEARVSMGRGSLSGPPALPRTLRTVEHVYRRAGTRAALIAQGGIMTGSDARDALAAGASAVSVYSGLIYRGPSVAKQISTELLALLEADGIESVAGLRGLSSVAAEPSRAVR
jgi:dihydroorotate dehydrogenase